MPPPRGVEIDVHDDDAGQRVDRFLRKLLRAAPLALIHRLIREGSVRRAGVKLRAKDHLEAGLPLTLALNPDRFAELCGARRSGPTTPSRLARRVVVLYEDEHLLAVAKPPGLAVQPGTGVGGEHLLGWLEAHLQGSERPSSTYRPAPAHRIDRATSGIVVCSKTAAAARALAAAFRDRTVHKTYFAVVHGHPRPPEAVIDRPLLVHDRGSTTAKTSPDDDGSPATTHYRTLRAERELTLLEVIIATGRTHQIRAHLAMIDHPIVGDTRYGAPRSELLPAGRIALHAAHLALPHPDTGEMIELEAPLPSDLARLVGAAGGD